MYRQCHLVKNATHQVSWIPAEKAVVGSVVDVKQTGREWERGWTVTSIGREERTWEQVNRDSRAHTWQRGSSDI